MANDIDPQNPDLKKLRKLIREVRVAMMTTVAPDGALRSRPMVTQMEKGATAVWMLTSVAAPKVGELRDDQRVNLSFSSPRDKIYVSVSGVASLVRDPERVRELWDRSFKAWFPVGKKDPDLALIRVTIDHAEYWDATAARMTQLAGFVKSPVANAEGSAMEHRKIDAVETAPAAAPLGAPRGGAQG
jgi:general stress protein 26